MLAPSGVGRRHETGGQTEDEGWAGGPVIYSWWDTNMILCFSEEIESHRLKNLEEVQIKLFLKQRHFPSSAALPSPSNILRVSIKRASNQRSRRRSLPVPMQRRKTVKRRMSSPHSPSSSRLSPRSGLRLTTADGYTTPPPSTSSLTMEPTDWNITSHIQTARIHSKPSVTSINQNEMWWGRWRSCDRNSILLFAHVQKQPVKFTTFIHYI